MTHPTDEELDEMARDLCHTGELSMLYRCEISDALTALRAQLAAANARADRAEAALAAQIEAADALGYTCTGCGHLCGDPDKDMKTLQRAGSISCCPERKMVPLSQAITHDRTALDRMLREAILEGMRIATFTPIEQVPSALDAAILAMIEHQ